MSGLFNYDNPIWRFMGKIADMAFLTLLWLLFSLPVVTIGASTTALYYVALKLAKDQESGIFRSFLSAFKKNFKQATVIWLIMLAFGALLGFNIRFAYVKEGSFATMLFWAFVFIAAAFAMVLTYIFPLLARIDNTTPNMFVISFVLSIKNFGWTLLMLTTTACMAALAVFAFWPLLIVAVGAIAYIHAKILSLIFEKYGWNLEDREGAVSIPENEEPAGITAEEQADITAQE